MKYCPSYRVGITSGKWGIYTGCIKILVTRTLFSPKQFRYKGSLVKWQLGKLYGAADQTYIAIYRLFFFPSMYLLIFWSNHRIRYNSYLNLIFLTFGEREREREREREIGREDSLGREKSKAKKRNKWEKERKGERERKRERYSYTTVQNVSKRLSLSQSLSINNLWLLW